MTVALYIVPYTRVTPPPGLLAARTCDLYLQLPALAGQLEQEVRGNRAFVKVNERAQILNQLDALYYRLPVDDLTASLSGVGASALTALENELLDMGYAQSEVDTAFPGGLGSVTMRTVVHFMASRVFAPRYDEGSDEIVLDGVERDERDAIGRLDERVR